MKDQKLYRVTVYGAYRKDVLVYGKSEEDACDYVQDICDNTNLITFDEGDLVELYADDVDVPDENCNDDCENCPAAPSCRPTFDGVLASQTPSDSSVTGAPLLHVPEPGLRNFTYSQPVKHENKFSRNERLAELMGNMIAQFYDTCEEFDELRDLVIQLLDECFQERMED